MRPRTLSVLLLAAASGFFVDLFLRWLGQGGHGISGWGIPLSSYAGVLALGVVLVELVRIVDVWTSRAASIVGFFLAAAAAVMGLSELINLRWGGVLSTGFGTWCYGAWIGLALAVVLLGLATARLNELSTS
jgi:hypothetical protein